MAQERIRVGRSNIFLVGPGNRSAVNFLYQCNEAAAEWAGFRSYDSCVLGETIPPRAARHQPVGAGGDGGGRRPGRAAPAAAAPQAVGAA